MRKCQSVSVILTIIKLGLIAQTEEVFEFHGCCGPSKTKVAKFQGMHFLKIPKFDLFLRILGAELLILDDLKN